MNTFKTKSLHAAVLAGLGAVGAVGTAQAVHVNPDGTGQVLLYPYYTVRADGTQNYDSLLTVVNSTSSTKAVKVRILEGKRSAEVLDFNLFLSPYDVWAGAIVRTAEGARLVSNDKSCVVPSDLFTTPNKSDFRNFVYAGSGDGGGDGLDRTREGYIEMLEMGNVTNTTWTGWIKHNSAGVPANCPALDSVDGQMSPGIVAPTGGLFGHLELINPASGSDFSYDAFAIDAWSPTEQYTDAGNVLPSLAGGGGAAAAASTPVSNVFINASASVLTTNWLAGGATATQAAADAISATMMHRAVLNEYNLETGTDSGTDWVVTFPTKKLYVNAGSGAARRPFSLNFNNGCSPELATINIYNREEGSPTTPIVLQPSPRPPVAPPRGLCYEANVISFEKSGLLGSTNNFDLTFLSVFGDTNLNRTGWAAVSFVETSQSMAPGATALTGAPTFRGLPVIGIAVYDYLNRGAQAGRLATYGANFAHKYRRDVTP